MAKATEPSCSQSRPRSSMDDSMTGAVRLDDYSHSPPHYFVAKNDLAKLRLLISALPRLSPPSALAKPPAARREDRAAEAVSAALDRRDVPRGETPLHLAVRLGRVSAAVALLDAGADPSLQDTAGWTPFQESLLLRRPRPLSLLLLRHHRVSALRKWRRRLPAVVGAIRGVRDFYLELNFRFESSVIPPFLLARAAPSDTYRIWKRGADVRADTSLAGFDGLRIARADRTFLFLGDGGGGSGSRAVDPGTLLVLDHERKEVCDALDGVMVVDEDNVSAEEEEEMVGEEAAAKVFRPGLDVTGAELVGRTNWRRREKVEMVGEWRARVYEVHNVLFSLKTRKAAANAVDHSRDILNLVLDLDDDKDEGFLVAEMPSMPMPSVQQARHSCYEPRQQRRDGGGGDIEWAFESAAEDEVRRRKSVDVPQGQCKRWEKTGGGGRRSTSVTSGGVFVGKERAGGRSEEKETVKNLRPMVWLTEDFPLKTEEVLPLLDVLANKVKAVRRLRELLTTKFPAGTFPVKVAIPVVPTVRVVVTFTKFVEFPSAEQFFTPLSSPRQFTEEEGHPNAAVHGSKSSSSWLKWGSTLSSKTSTFTRSKSISPSPQAGDDADPFAIPREYAWVSSSSKNQRGSKSKKGSHRRTGFVV